MVRQLASASRAAISPRGTPALGIGAFAEKTLVQRLARPWCSRTGAARVWPRQGRPVHPLVGRA
ncbi:hypothetical protein D7D52_31735 [Nocardia yunnanensis]|uniref:Uncharacterized protein n=1 Tax=Nocardia yunnanensis TaxID=2382165 RepID=A0A386ZLV7_9NOCA|nr:hypothetical protein D7D52_31735 [Nocardia yunnanensis]